MIKLRAFFFFPVERRPQNICSSHTQPLENRKKNPYLEKKKNFYRGQVQPPALQKLGVGIHVSNPSTQEVRTGGSEVEGRPQLHSEFENSLNYMRLSQIANQKNSCVSLEKDRHTFHPSTETEAGRSL